MRSEKATARVVGILFIVATAVAVIGDLLLRPIRDADDYLVDLAANEGRVILGVLSEVTLAVEPLGAIFAVSALILYWLLYQSQIVPRWLSIWGFAGGVLLLVAGLLGMWGESSTSTTSILLTLPIGLNEMVLAVWLILRGVTPSHEHARA